MQGILTPYMITNPNTLSYKFLFQHEASEENITEADAYVHEWVKRLGLFIKRQKMRNIVDQGLFEIWVWLKRSPI